MPKRENKKRKKEKLSQKRWNEAVLEDREQDVFFGRISIAIHEEAMKMERKRKRDYIR